MSRRRPIAKDQLRETKGWKWPKSFTVGQEDIDRLAAIAKAKNIENNDSLVVREIIKEVHERLTAEQ